MNKQVNTMKHSLLRWGLLVATFGITGGVAALIPAPFIDSAQAAPKVPAALLVTPKSIGPARLGQSVAALKRAFPGSTVYVPADGPVEYYTLKRNGRDFLYFLTREGAKGDSSLVRDADIVSSMETSDPNFRTSRGIGPGSWLHNAVAVHGEPRLSFNMHEESSIFPAYSNKLWFVLEGPRDSNLDRRVAGLYTDKELKRLNGTTTRFKRGTRIVSIGCRERS